MDCRQGLAYALARAEAMCIRHARKRAGRMNFHEAIAHVAQGIEYSMTGYPRHKSKLFQATVGRLALEVSLRRGVMLHDRDAVIPGAPGVRGDYPAITRLRLAIEAFDAHRGSFAPHFAFGPLAKNDYAKVHAMHLADHLRAFGHA
jgi:Protein of unknown function (DUF1569)